MNCNGYTLFEPECLPAWKVYNQVFGDGSGRVMEMSNKQGNILRFIYSSMHHHVYLQWIGYQHHTMSALKDIAKWQSIFWSTEAHSRNIHDCVACTFDANNMHLLGQSLNLIESESPLGEIRNQIYSFLSACDLVIPSSYQCEPNTMFAAY